MMNHVKKAAFVVAAATLIDDAEASDDHDHDEYAEIPDGYDMNWSYDAAAE